MRLMCVYGAHVALLRVFLSFHVVMFLKVTFFCYLERT